MKKAKLYAHNVNYLHQAVTVWLILFAAVLIFATLSTMLFAYGVAREQSLLGSLAIVGTLSVLTLIIIHNHQYSLSKLRGVSDAFVAESWFAIGIASYFVILYSFTHRYENLIIDRFKAPSDIVLALIIAFAACAWIVGLCVIVLYRHYMNEIARLKKELDRISDEKQKILEKQSMLNQVQPSGRSE
jgi:hypothetical protein